MTTSAAQPVDPHADRLALRRPAPRLMAERRVRAGEVCPACGRGQLVVRRGGAPGVPDPGLVIGTGGCEHA